jgi:hypothetical protein
VEILCCGNSQDGRDWRREERSMEGEGWRYCTVESLEEEEEERSIEGSC